MNNEKTRFAILFLTIYSLILTFLFIFSIDVLNDKTNYILNLEKENNQCNIELDSIKQDYERLQNE